MTNLITPSDLNTTLNHEPRVRDLTIAERLGMAAPYDIRRTIEANRAELEGYGDLASLPSGGFGAAPRNPGTKGGRPGREYYLNEGQALVLCALSRTPKAAEVRKALIDVFMAFRTGKIAPAAPTLSDERAEARRRNQLRHWRAKADEAAEHLRDLGEERPALPAPARFAPGSDILRDLYSAVMSANLRVERGEAASFAEAFEDVIADLIEAAAGNPPSRKALLDWHHRRTTGKGGRP